MPAKVAALFLVAALSACSVAQDVADDLARDRAKSVVNDVVETNLPGVNARPVTGCVIDAASAQEILTIARASVTGVSDATVHLVLDIARRPDAVTCIATAALAS